MRFLSSFFVAFLCFILLTETALAARPLIIDTDVGVDDALAMLYLLKRPEFEIKAITISATGNAACGPAFANTLSLLKLVKHTKIPVACGRSQPLSGRHHFPASVLAESATLAGSSQFLPRVQAKPRQQAVALLIKVLQSSHEPVTLVAIGPLTNIAEALQKAPQIKSHIRALVIMGGALRVPGNVGEVDASIKNQGAEWNFYLDPLAAQRVFKAKLPLILVPLDVTNKLPLDLSFYERLKHQHRTPEATYVYRLLRMHRKSLQAKEWYFWDPLAAVIASDETVAVYKEEALKILLGPETESGRVVVSNSSGQRFRVTEKVDENRFKQLLIDALNS